MNQETLLQLFNIFDTDQSGIITRENIVTALQKMGMEIT
jgi:Ca2+-binding EF-hand superfamily protein